MNNEIKEIKHRLELLHAECNPKAREEDIDYTLNYITNLQQELIIMVKDDEKSQETIIRLTKENERLKYQLEVQQDLTIKNRLRKHIYKSRCEKAIEFIKKYCIDDEFYINLSYKEKAIIEVLNILQNGSDDNE